MSSPSQHHRARKRFGQNFLHDDGVIHAIAAAVAPTSNDHVVEIGPGQGALTEILAPSVGRLDVIELDRDLVPLLLASFSIYDHFTLHNADALAFNFTSLLEARSLPDSEGRQLRIVGNLPYNISTPLMFKLLADSHIVKDMHFMLQREVVDRLAAQPGSKHWGRLGAMTQYHCRVEHLLDVPPEAFRPMPRVQSAVVRLTPWNESPWPECDTEHLAATLQKAFAQRRKTLRNNLKGLIDSAGLESLGIDPGARAETLSLTDFIQLANTLYVEH